MFLPVMLSFATEDDRDKFEFLYEKYKKLLYYKSYEILKDQLLAEDAVSEAYMRIYRNLHKIADVESKKTVSFVVTIVRNVSLTLLKKEKRSQTVSLEGYEESGVQVQEKETINMEEQLVSKFAAEELLYLIDGLKDELKEPFLLKYAHDLSHKDISEILEISENNVTVRIHRARKKIIEIIGKEA